MQKQQVAIPRHQLHQSFWFVFKFLGEPKGCQQLSLLQNRRHLLREHVTLF